MTIIRKPLPAFSPSNNKSPMIRKPLPTLHTSNRYPEHDSLGNVTTTSGTRLENSISRDAPDLEAGERGTKWEAGPLNNINETEASELEKSNSQPPEEQEWKATAKEWLMLLTLTPPGFIVALDGNILLAVLPQLATQLHGTSTEAFWVATSYLMVHGVLQPFIAALSDIFGRREVLFPSILFFLAGSIICGEAHNFTTLLAGRVIQGVGGAGIIPLGQLICADIIPLRQRPKYFSFVLLAWAVGSMTGPLIGGLLSQHSTWRWCFWINIPFCVIGMVMTIFCVKLKTEKTSLKFKLSQVDWIGGFLFVSSLTSLLIAISWGGIQFSWKSVSTLLPLILGAVGLVGTLVWEQNFAKNPFLPRTFFPNVSAITIYITSLLYGACIYLGLYYITFYFASVKLASATRAGVNDMAALAFTLPASIVVSQMITRLGTFRWAIWIGWFLTTISAGMLIRWDQNTSKAYWASSLAILGIGMGMVLQSLNFAVQAAVSSKDSGRAAALYAFMRSVGTSVGVAIGGSAFQNVLQHKLTSLNVPNALQISKNAESFVATLHTLQESDPLRIMVTEGYVSGFKACFGIFTAIGGISLILSILIRHANMDKTLESKYRAR